jgi:hypothetical protein
VTDDQVREMKFNNWPIADEYLIELGRIAALWGSLESGLNMCLGKLAGFNELNDPTPFILFAHASFPQRLDMLGSLCEHLSSSHPNLKEHPKVIGALKTAQKLRNKYAHNGLSSNDATGDVQIATGSARGTLKFSVETVSLTDLRRVSMAIHQAMLDLYKLVLKREIPAMWERPQDWKSE